MAISIREANGADDLETVRHLFSAYARSLPIDLGYQGFEDELAALPGKYAPPNGTMLLAEDEAGQALGCVAVRPLDEDICEMKRLYISPEGRGAGVGRQLAETAITAARQMHYREMRLDTLASMTAAQMLYVSLGFVRIDSYYETPVEGTVFMALEL